jgi:hypothetical protein
MPRDFIFAGYDRLPSCEAAQSLMIFYNRSEANLLNHFLRNDRQTLILRIIYPSVSGCQRASALPLFFAHCVFDGAYDKQQDAAADTAAEYAGYNTAEFQTAAARRRNSQHIEQLAAEATAQYADDGIPQSAQGKFLHQRAGTVAADSTAKQLNDPVIHGFSSLKLKMMQLFEKYNGRVFPLPVFSQKIASLFS